MFSNNLQIFINKLKQSIKTRNLVDNIMILNNRYGNEYLKLAEQILSIMEVMNLDSYNITKKYIIDYIKQASSFLREGNYGYKSFNEIKKTIYDNEDVMMQIYMPGLLTAYISMLNLYTKYDFFMKKFLPMINDNSIGIDVGFGEGFYLWKILENTKNVRCNGMDISPYAIEFTTNLLTCTKIKSNRYNLYLGDINKKINCQEKSQDFVVLAEIIEHLEKPERAIMEISPMLKRGGILFLSTVINNNHMDHISNFESPDVIEEMLVRNGFNILESCIHSVQDDFPNSLDKAVGLAYVCRLG